MPCVISLSWYLHVSIRFNRYVIDVQCPRRAVSHAMRSGFTYSSRTLVALILSSFYYFLMLKIVSFSIAFLYSYLRRNPHLSSLTYVYCGPVEIYSTFLVFFLHSFRACTFHQILSLSLFSPSFPSPPSYDRSLQISVFSLSVFYPPPCACLALAAPYFLNLSGSILFGSLLGSSNTRSEVLLSSLLSILHESSSQLELVSSSLPSFLTLFRAFFIPASVALLLSFLLSPSRRLAHVYGHPL